LLFVCFLFYLNIDRIDEHNWKNTTQPGSSLLNARQFATIIQVFDLTKDYYTMFEVLSRTVIVMMMMMLLLL